MRFPIGIATVSAGKRGSRPFRCTDHTNTSNRPYERAGTIAGDTSYYCTVGAIEMVNLLRGNGYRRTVQYTQEFAMIVLMTRQPDPELEQKIRMLLERERI